VSVSDTLLACSKKGADVTSTVTPSEQRAHGRLKASPQVNNARVSDESGHLRRGDAKRQECCCPNVEMFEFLKPSSLRRDARPSTDEGTLNTRLVIELTATVAQLRLELDGVTKRIEGLDRRRATTTMPGDRAFRLAEVSAIAGHGRRRSDRVP